MAENLPVESAVHVGIVFQVDHLNQVAILEFHLVAVLGRRSMELSRIGSVAHVELVDVDARKGRNPRTGDIVDVPAKTVVKVRRRKGLNDVSKNLS